MSQPRRTPTASSVHSQSQLPSIGEKILHSRWSESDEHTSTIGLSLGSRNQRGGISQSAKHDTVATGPVTGTNPIISVSSARTSNSRDQQRPSHDFVIVEDDQIAYPPSELAVSYVPRPDKASRLLGIKHRSSMEPIPPPGRLSVASAPSTPLAPVSSPASTLPLTSLYVVSGLPKSPQTWTLADADSVLGLSHTENAVNRWWRPEVLGSTVSPGVGGTSPGLRKKSSKRSTKMDDNGGTKGTGALSKAEVGKMLSKALKLSFTREVEVVASTLQPASTVHTFTFSLPTQAPLASELSAPSFSVNLRSSVLSSDRLSLTPSDPFARPSSAYLGPQTILGHSASASSAPASGPSSSVESSNNTTYHGLCLTVWSHADAERSAAIRRTLESSNPRVRKESSQSRLRALRTGSTDNISIQARRSTRKNSRGPWSGAGATTDAETDAETEAEGAISESDFEVTNSANPGESTLFLPGDTVFWLPYALTLVSRHPIYDLMRDYLTLSWARFSKDVQSHTLQISKILSHPTPRTGELVRLDASPSPPQGRAGAITSSAHDPASDADLEVIARFPGGLDFGRGLVDINFTMWPLFKCLNVDNILTICEIALAPTGRILFFSKHPTMLGIAVATIKYLVELRGWSGIALPAVHSRDAKIFVDDPGPWILGLATEARYSVIPPPEVCLVDLDINYLNCQSPPPGAVSIKQQREKFRQRLLAAFDSPNYHPDHSVPSEFKEAFPAGRFRPICKIQAKRAASSAAVADQIKPPDWWHSTKIIQAFDSVLQEKAKRPSLFKRLSSFGSVPKNTPRLTPAEQHIQMSIRKRATAFVDARDDLETKMGRLSRRLNFLMTESDLWRDKFVTFEQYAEKLSAEAGQLRAKINKEQRETKRLSGLYTMTAAEKIKLENDLKTAEQAHKEAQVELLEMREAMERMEDERAEMVAEVEAQIERALASMSVDIDMDSDYSSNSRPNSRLSNFSSGQRSRRGSEAGRSRNLRSRGTESTLAESYDGGEDEIALLKVDRETTTINEEEEAELVPSPRKKRFSITEVDARQDGMNAVDEGISQRSDKIAQKVLEIQQKLESALASDKKHRRGKRSKSSVITESGEESTASISTRSRPSKGARLVHSPPPRARRSSAATATSGTRTPVAQGAERANSPDKSTRPVFIKSVEPGHVTPPGEESSSSGAEDRSTTPEPALQARRQSLRKIASGASLSAMNPAHPPVPIPASGLAPTIAGHADESDTDFQSAYSNNSPRDSYIEGDTLPEPEPKTAPSSDMRPVSAFQTAV